MGIGYWVYSIRVGFLAIILAGCQLPDVNEWLWGSDESVEQIELELLGWSASEEENVLLQEMVDQFNLDHPESHVVLHLIDDYQRNLRIRLTDDDLPDLLMVTSFMLPELVASNILVPQNYRSETVADIYPTLLDAFTLNGNRYCLPREFSTLALIYNKTLFDEAELAYPTAAWTWRELRNAAESIANTTNPFYTTYGMIISADFSRWLPFLYQAGGRVTNSEQTAMTLDSTPAAESMNFYLDLILDGFAIQPTELSSSWAGEAFGKGRAGMILEGNWIVPYLAQEFPDLQYGIVELPTGAASKATVVFSTCYAITSMNSETQKTAILLADYLTNTENLRRWSQSGRTLPPRISLRDAWLAQHPIQAPFLDSVIYAHPWRFPPDFQNVVNAINDGMKRVWDADINAAEVLRIAQSVGNEILER